MPDSLGSSWLSSCLWAPSHRSVSQTALPPSSLHRMTSGCAEHPRLWPAWDSLLLAMLWISISELTIAHKSFWNLSSELLVQHLRQGLTAKILEHSQGAMVVSCEVMWRGKPGDVQLSSSCVIFLEVYALTSRFLYSLWGPSGCQLHEFKAAVQEPLSLSLPLSKWGGSWPLFSYLPLSSQPCPLSRGHDRDLQLRTILGWRNLSNTTTKICQESFWDFNYESQMASGFRLLPTPKPGYKLTLKGRRQGRRNC